VKEVNEVKEVKEVERGSPSPPLPGERVRVRGITLHSSLFTSFTRRFTLQP